MMLSEETSAVRPQKQTRFNGAKLVWMLKGSPLTVTSAVIIVSVSYTHLTLPTNREV